MMTSAVFWLTSSPNEVIPYSRHLIEQDDIDAVAQVLRSDFLTQGPVIEMFESALASYARARYAVLFSSGTAALHAAYYAAGVRKRDEVITSPITFAATSNAALYLGARPVFVDVEPDTGNINIEHLEQAITPRTRAIVPVHYGGHPADLETAFMIAKKTGTVVIEDACHALGAGYKSQGSRGQEPGAGKGKTSSNRTQDQEPGAPGLNVGWTKIGSCRYSDMTVFSFHPVKHVATGEGGAVLTNCKDYYEKLNLFRTHGITKDHSKFKTKNSKLKIHNSSDGWYYEMQELGFNYRISDIQAALGLSQLGKLDRFVSKRRKIADQYKAAFADTQWFAIPPERSYAKSSYHLYSVRLLNGIENKKSMIFSRLKDAGIGVQVHYIPVYLHPYYRTMGFKEGLCPAAEKFYQREMSIPLYPGMNDETVGTVIKTVRRLFTAA
jgi:dTDP-4-amino-4,6-dideoxygalactose transaminase